VTIELKLVKYVLFTYMLLLNNIEIKVLECSVSTGSEVFHTFGHIVLGFACHLTMIIARDRVNTCLLFLSTV